MYTLTLERLEIVARKETLLEKGEMDCNWTAAFQWVEPPPRGDEYMLRT